jgi:hypothetical protein
LCETAAADDYNGERNGRERDTMDDRNIVIERTGGGYRVRYESQAEETARDIGALVIVAAGLLAVIALVEVIGG